MTQVDLPLYAASNDYRKRLTSVLGLNGRHGQMNGT